MARVRRAHAPGRQRAARARPRRVLEGRRRDDLGVQAEARREVPRRLRADRRRRRVLARPPRDHREQSRLLRAVHATARGEAGRRPLHRAAPDGQPLCDGAVRHELGVHPVEARGLGRTARGVQSGQGRDRHRALLLRRLQARRPRGTGALRAVRRPTAGVGQGHAADHDERSRPDRRTARGRRRRDRAGADGGSRETARQRQFPGRAEGVLADDLPAPRPVSRPRARGHRQVRAAARPKSVQGRARPQGRLDGREPAGDRRARDGGRGGARVEPRRTVGIRLRVRAQAGAVRRGRREEAPRGCGFPERFLGGSQRAEQSLRQRRAAGAGARADAHPRRHHDARRDGAGERLLREGAQPGVRDGDARLGLVRRRPRPALAGRDVRRREGIRHLELGSVLEPARGQPRDPVPCHAGRKQARSHRA